MEIRAFSQLCLAIAMGRDTASLLPNRPLTQNEQTELLKTASVQRVLPLICQFVHSNPDLFKKTTKGSKSAALRNPIFFKTRSMHMKAQLLEIDQKLAGTSLHPVLLKGAIQLFDGLYPSIAMRHMSDIDILSTDPRFGDTLTELGYDQLAPDLPKVFDNDGNPALRPGENHLAPVTRQSDVVIIEPHLIPTSPIHSHLVPNSFETDVCTVPGCTNLRQPIPEYHLVHILIHALLHNRDTLDGGLLVKGLLDCELLFQKMTPQERNVCESHFKSCNSLGFWNSWRALADWTFHDNPNARYRSASAFFLISEFQIRALGYTAVFVVSLLNRAKAPFHIRYWSSGTYVKHGKRLMHRNFWSRLKSHLIGATGR